VKYLSIIENYFLGKLEGEAFNRFTEDLKNNSELKEEFVSYKRALEFALSQEKDLIDSINKLKDFEFDSKILEDIEKYRTKWDYGREELQLISLLKAEEKNKLLNSFKCSFKIRWYKIVAGLLLIVGTGGLILILNHGNPTNDELFDKYFTPFHYSVIVRSLTQDYNPNLIEGTDLYDIGNYDQALKIFEKIPDNDRYSEVIILFKAGCFMKLDKYNQAINILDKINEDCDLYSTALWYKGLCYLKLKENKEASSIFEALSVKSPYYKKLVCPLIKDLR
jgi:tetratricopeptide (TPR) repeat protein